MKDLQLYEVTPVSNLKELIESSFRLYGSKNAFLVKNKEGKFEGISYSKYKKDIDALGTALLELGLKDKFIALLGENRYEWCVTYLSVVNGTGVIVPLDKELPKHEILNLLKRCGAGAVVYSGKYGGIIKEISESLDTVKCYINMDSREHTEGELSFAKLVERGEQLMAEGCRDYTDAEIDNVSMSMLLFTSGTTDTSKGVMLCHKNICSNIVSVRSTVLIKSDDVSLSILPLHHTYECTLGFLTLIYSGATIAFNEGLKHISKNLKEVQPTVLVLVPLILENMYRKIWEQARKKPGMELKLKTALAISRILYNAFGIDIRRRIFSQIHDNIGGRVRLVITGAAAVEKKVSKGFREMGITVLQGYGLTECSPLVIGSRDKVIKDGSIGIPIPGVEVKIENQNSSEVGEIVVKGDNVMLGYYQNEEATEKYLKDGWFYTGDLGKVDDEGYYHITGRSKNVIVTKNGKNIYPEEVEAHINKSPFVYESLVWGKADITSGEVQINAQIFPNLEAIKEKLKVPHVSKDELMKVVHEVIKNVNKGLPLYKHIKNFTIRENEFVKTTTQKIKRYMVGKSGNKDKDGI